MNKIFELSETPIKIFLCFMFYEYLIGYIENLIQGNVLKTILGFTAFNLVGFVLMTYELTINDETEE